jgi:preprotein translocase subunit SecA
MKTGEGKTLVSTLPPTSVAGKGVHLVTTNDYLAKRARRGWGRSRVPGFTIGVIPEIDDPELKRQATPPASPTDQQQVGFDYLRDNMAGSLEEQAARSHFLAIVDEVDSILIDEADAAHHLRPGGRRAAALLPVRGS